MFALVRTQVGLTISSNIYEAGSNNLLLLTITGKHKTEMYLINIRCS